MATVRKVISTLLLLLTASRIAGYGQELASTDEHYRQVVRLITARKYEDSLAAARRLIERTEEHERVFYRILQAAREWGQIDKAKALFDSLTPADPRGYYGLGLYYAEKRDYDAAIENYKKCLRELPEYPLPLLALINGYRALKRGAEAENYIKALLSANPNSAAAHLGMGYYQVSIRRPDDAWVQMQRALTLNPKLADACYYGSLGFSNVDRFHDALATLSKCLPPLESSLNDEHRFSFRLQVGSALSVLGNYTEAVKNIEESLHIATGMDDRSGQEFVLGFLGRLHIRHDNYAPALVALRQALEIARRDNRPSNLSSHLNGLARLYAALGDLSRAREHYEQALELASNLDSKLDILSNLGGMFAAQNDSTRAIESFNRLLELERTAPNRHPRMIVDEAEAFIHAYAGDSAKAMESLVKAAATARQGGNIEQEMRATNGLGNLYLRAGDLQHAAEAFNRALQLALDRGSPHHVWRAYHGLGRSFELRGEFERAREAYRLAVETMESVRARLAASEERAFFFQDKLEPYQRLAAVLMRLGRAANTKGDSATAQRFAAEARHVSERARARAMLDRLGAITAGALDHEVEADLKAERWQIQARFSQAETQLRRATATQPADAAKRKVLEDELKLAAEAMMDWQRRLRQRNPHLADLRYPEPLTVEQVQQLLKQP
ncbi:MAG: tetratricopeptide repeat protein [Acidobacteria bacterium]|nr:tetratricopeptide repeat protein [Acidobacteriota bacterium]